MNDFGINESVLDGDTTELVDDQLAEATQRFTEAKERILALCLARGYDGVDLAITRPRIARVEDFRRGIEWEGWNGEPEPLEPYASHTQRYDFRFLDDGEKRRLLARVGLQLEEVNDAGD